MARTVFHVDILHIPEEKPRTPRVIASYPNIEASSIVLARQAGLEQWRADNPSGDWSLVYGQARPAE